MVFKLKTVCIKDELYGIQIKDCLYTVFKFNTNYIYGIQVKNSSYLWYSNKRQFA